MATLLNFLAKNRISLRTLGSAQALTTTLCAGEQAGDLQPVLGDMRAVGGDLRLATSRELSRYSRQTRMGCINGRLVNPLGAPLLPID